MDAHTDAFIARVSGDPPFRPSVHKMSDWLAAQLRTVGVEIGSSPHKETVLIYGHFDVQPAAKSDPWDTEQEDDRGSSDGKASIRLPVNLVFCFEGMEENGSEILSLLPYSYPEACAGAQSDNYWLTYGPRGIVYFKLALRAIFTLVCVLHFTFVPRPFLVHSFLSSVVVTSTRTLVFPAAGVFGRTVHGPMTDLIALMGRLVSLAGNILVPGVDDMVSAADVPPSIFLSSLRSLPFAPQSIYDKLDYSIADVDCAHQREGVFRPFASRPFLPFAFRPCSVLFLTRSYFFRIAVRVFSHSSTMPQLARLCLLPLSTLTLGSPSLTPR
ncbi:hypothetical protein B0H13DRAFT_2311603 [Mycena leptocephala]|nr:hypothetical protein B0H13DRAFT_2311603 [Mycena leptocephala]